MQLVPIPRAVRSIPGRESDAENELIFIAADLPALGFKSYFVQKTVGNIVTKGHVHENTLENEVSWGWELLSDF